MKHPHARAALAGLLLGTIAISAAQAATATRTSSFEYDPATGLLTKEIAEPGNTQLRLEIAYSYDAWGNRNAATVSSPATGTAAIASRSASVTFDARGQFPTADTNALSQSESKAVDPKFGALTSLTGPNGLTTQWQYDNFGRKIREIRADGTQTRWDYFYCSGVAGGTAACPSLAKYLVQITPLASGGAAANGPWTKIYYNELGREIGTETQGFDGTSVIKKSVTYDSLGRFYGETRPYYSTQTPVWTTRAYDSLSRVVTLQYPDNSKTTFTYNGLTTVTKNALNQTRTQTRDALGRIVTMTDAANNTLTYQYDAFDNLIKTTDPKGNVVTHAYDIRGNKTQSADPDMGTWTYVYDALGELVKQTDGKSQITTIAYDKLGRVTSQSESDLVSTWTYDSCTKGIGKLCKATADNGYVRTVSYDSLGRPLSTATTIDAAYTASVTYDANGRIATQTYPTGLAVKYVYTSLGYLKEVRNNATNALYWSADTRDAEGHLLQQTYGNNIITQQVYDANTGLLKNVYAGAGNSVQNLSYSYDTVGNLQSRSDANQSLSETFLYDALNRLTSATVNSNGAGVVTQTYGYDSLGNIASRSDVGTYTYGAVNAKPHALTQIALAAGGKRTYAYDANGNLTTEAQYDAASNVITGKGRSATYTSFNMPKVLSAPSVSLTFTYGPEHQRVKQIAPGATTIYLHPDNEGGLLYEKDIKSDGTVEHKHFIVAGSEVIALVRQTNAGASTRYFHRDHLGSTAAMTNETGSVVERFAYEPFGKRRFLAGNADANNTIAGVNTDRGFTNHEHLDELGLIHMNGRVYDPMTGRFMSADPTVPDPLDMQTFNRYAYVLNNPLMYVDPSGFFDDAPGGGVYTGFDNSHDPTAGFGGGGITTGGITIGINAGSSSSSSSGSKTQSGNANAVTGRTPDGELNLHSIVTATRDVINLDSSAYQGFAANSSVMDNVNDRQALSQGTCRTPSNACQAQNAAYEAAYQRRAQGDAIAPFTEVEKFAAGGAAIGGIFRGLTAGYAALTGTTATADALAATGISNAVPSELARIIPGRGNFPTLGPPTRSDVFVTAADDIAGLNAKQIAHRLTINEAETFTVIRFPTPQSGLASPVNRLDPGFIGGGRTAGGAREFVIPNGTIPAGARIEVVGP